MCNPEKSERRESAVSLDMLHFSDIQALTAFFPVKMSIDVMRTYRCWTSDVFFTRTELEFWLTNFGKVFSVLRHLDIPTYHSRKLLILNFYQGLNWRRYNFKWSSDGRKKDNFSWTELLISQICENLQSTFTFSRIPAS